MDDIAVDLTAIKNLKNSNIRGKCVQNNAGQNNRYWRTKCLQ